MKPLVAVADYGLGNIPSVTRAFERANARVVVSDSAAIASSADGVVICGVGSFGAGVRNLESTGWLSAVKQHAAKGKPIFGICLGMQVLFDASEEAPGEHGASILEGSCVKLGAPIIPHMGWSRLTNTREMFECAESEYVYFVHSFVVKPTDDSIIASTAEHGVSFCAAVIRGNIVGTQFHPEKSSSIGQSLLNNWVASL